VESNIVIQAIDQFRAHQPFDVLIYSPHDDGNQEMDLEWYYNPGCIVSVTVDGERVYYAYLLPNGRGHGEIKLGQELPEDLIKAIQEVQLAKL